MTPRTLFATAAVSLLAACGGEPPETTAAEPVDATVAAKPLDASSSPGKPTVPVELGYEFLQAPAVGQPLTIRLRIDGRADIASPELRTGTRGALALSKNTPARIALKPAATDGAAVMSQDLVVTPSDTGRSYVNVQVTGMFDGAPFTKAMSIPVQVGEGGPRLETTGEIIDDGVEVLSSMPADQTLESGDTD